MGVYTIGIITLTGYPYKEIILNENEPNSDLHLRFYDLSGLRNNQNPERIFSLEAGLMAALIEFSRQIGQGIKYLRFRATNNDDPKVLAGDGKELIKSHSILPVRIPLDGNVIITVKSERFIGHESLECKVHIIYNKIIRIRQPISIETVGLDKDEIQFIKDVLLDKKARDLIEIKKSIIQKTAKQFLKQQKIYGLRAIAITSFDNQPLFSAGMKIEEVYSIFRDMAHIPEVGTFQWKYRTGKMKNSAGKFENYWVYFIGGSAGVNVEGVYQRFNYVLICSPESFLGEFPEHVYNSFDNILEN